ncbi:MAG: pyridoxamine 5'-phosphate oxidase family protein [Thermomicrobia bacterium]|nr:pyridoxamine 5'-phosphate oxidase family protein [Thermomicrobia bacterium]MCA1724761.1 pyridoxamine 5'-phosphate oxidase family protein [Thermomicrobia bacterium]
MHETPEDMERLQALLNRSIERAGAFLRSSFEIPEHSFSAGQLVHYLQGIQNVAFATVTAKGEPRVAPIGSLFSRGRFHIPTVTTAARTRMVMKRPAVSLTHYTGNDLAIIAHGNATLIPTDHADFAALEEMQRVSSGSSVRDWGEGVYLRVEAETLVTFARYPDQFPSKE